MDIGECYLILGLEEGAGKEEIKSAYRKLAMQYHPDKTQGDEFLANMFIKIQTAYETLSNSSGHEESYSSKRSAPVYKDNPVLKQLIADYQKAQQSLSDEQYKLNKIQHSQKIRYLSVSNLLKLIGGFMLISVFFYPERLKSNKKQPSQVNQNRWVLKDQANLYLKPDMKTKVLKSLKPGDQLDSIGETRYYYKVRLDSGKARTLGYILKTKIGIDHE